MPAYVWSCLACGSSNPPEFAACSKCGCPAAAAVREIDAARASAKHTSSPNLESEPLPSLVVCTGWALLLLGGFGFKWAPFGWSYLASFGLIALGFAILKWGT
jgi:hypothetical protein